MYLYTCLHSPIQASEAAVSRWQPLLKLDVPSSWRLGSSQPLWKNLQEEIRNRSVQAVAGSLLSLGVKSVPSPARHGFQLEKRGQGHGAMPSQPPPGPLLAHQCLIDAGWGACSAALPLASAQPSCCSSGRRSAFCPSKLETIWTEVGSPVFRAFWTFFTPPGRLLGGNVPETCAELGGTEQGVVLPRAGGGGCSVQEFRRGHGGILKPVP